MKTEAGREIAEAEGWKQKHTMKREAGWEIAEKWNLNAARYVFIAKVVRDSTSSSVDIHSKLTSNSKTISSF